MSEDKFRVVNMFHGRSSGKTMLQAQRLAIEYTEKHLGKKIEIIQCDHEEIENLKAQIEQYENGYKGACQCCEPVGELNVKLKAQVEMIEEGIEYCIKLFSQLKDMSNRKDLLLDIEEKLKQMRE